MSRVQIIGAPTPAQALALHRTLFPESGEYVIAKAEVPAAPVEQFEAWFLEQLAGATRQHFVSAEYAIWEVLDKLLQDRGVRAPSQLGLWELHRTLFDLSTASTARMVGFQVPQDVVTRLTGFGFTLPEALDAPALAYRMGLMYQHLVAAEPVPWEQLVQDARAFPLASAEREAVAIARQRAGTWLKPIFDDVGNVWTADREITPLRRIVGDALEQRRGTREAARELGASQRAQGVLRDADRVIRTEVANARSQGAWAADSKHWAPDVKLFRQTSRNACRDCLRLYKNPDGTPRLYAREELTALDAQGPNVGPRDGWGPRIGATHPNCACGVWAAYLPAMAAIFERRAPEYAELMQRLKVFEGAKAAA